MGKSKTRGSIHKDEATAATRALGPSQANAGANWPIEIDATEITATSAGRGLRGARVEKDELAPGTQVGRYMVLNKIAAGGMGAIYAAFDPDLDRKIALKVLAVDRQESETVSLATARMIREAKALAQLSHPNVVAVHDVGRYEGDVFIAMALVEGQTLRSWNKQPHSIAEIVELFTGAGEGLAAAHRAGLVHRDFKPDNVLIGDDGRVRVVDFGIARSEAADDAAPADSALSGSQASRDAALDALSSSAIESSDDLLESADFRTPSTARLTQAGALVGTPAYMSPEQFLGDAVDSRSDQFSFCIALYESLYGQRPFAGKGARQLKRAVITGRVRDPGKDNRVPAHLRKLVERGLSVLPEDRYASMDALLAALRDDPRTRRRRRLATGVALATVCASLFAARATREDPGARCENVAAAVDSVWSSDARGALSRAFASTPAAYAADTARRVTHLIDERAEAWKRTRRGVCEATWVRGEQSEALLDTRMYCLDRRLNELTSLVAMLSGAADGELVDRAVEAASSLSPVKACATIADIGRESAVPPPTNPAKRALLNALHKRIDELRVMNATGRYSQGVEASKAVAADAEALGYAPAQAELMQVRGRLLEGAGDHEAAQDILARGLALAARAGDHRLGASMEAQRIFIVGYRLDRHDEALVLAPGAEAAMIRAGDPTEPRATLARALGSVYFSMGQYAQALEYMESSVALLEKTLADDHIGLADPLNSVGLVLVYQQKYDQGIPYLERARGVFEQALGPDHPRMGIPLTNLGMAYYQSGRLDEALSAHARALEVFERSLGPDHLHVATALGNLGELFAEEGELAKAEKYHRRAIAIQESHGHHRHHAYAFSLNNLGNTLRKGGKYEGALDFHRRAIEVYEVSVGGDHEFSGRALVGVGGALIGLGKAAEAIEPLERAVELLEAAESADLPHARFSLARALWASGRDRAGARRLAEQARAALADRPDPAGVLRGVEAWLAEHGTP